MDIGHLDSLDIITPILTFSIDAKYFKRQNLLHLTVLIKFENAQFSSFPYFSKLLEIIHVYK